MDQESFRKILNTSRTSTPAVLGGGSRARISLAPPPPKSKTIDASQPVFKPRTVKKIKDSKYRDRASERRGGDGNDYAHVEAVLDEFEKRNASTDKETLEAQRKYLGGDAEHSILVKGLDFALLEQNKARSVLTNEDVDALDQAYKEASSHEPVVPKKRAREDILAELKKSREGGSATARKNDASLSQSAEEETRLLEEAKQKGKFKPIGFKPIGSANDKKKRTSTAEDGGQKKKKKKLKAQNGAAAVKTTDAGTPLLTTPAPPTPIPEEPEAPVDDDFDIFADAGEYNPLDLDEGEDDDERKHTGEGRPEASSSTPRTRWIANDNTDPQEERPEVSLPASTTVRSEVSSDLDEEDMEDKHPQRLIPLFSSALPSIKDLLAADKAAGSHKRKKDKKKAPTGNDNEESKKRSLESKVDRDYKRLKTYTDKKTASLDNDG